jgi:anti-sigma28 factor (negative regulator of flagellin synthesis)
LKTQALLAIDQSGPIDDDGLIAEIRQRIAEGRFGIDYARIAEAMTAAGHRVN